MGTMASDCKAGWSSFHLPYNGGIRGLSGKNPSHKCLYILYHMAGHFLESSRIHINVLYMWHIHIYIYICVFYCGHLISFQEINGMNFMLILLPSYTMEKQSTFILKTQKYDMYVCEPRFHMHTGSQQVGGGGGRCPQSSRPKGGTLGMMACVTHCRRLQNFAWRPRVFLFETKLFSPDYKNDICLFFKNQK